jgi:hypothetical protein
MSVSDTTTFVTNFATMFATRQLENAKRREETNKIIRDAEIADDLRQAIVKNAEKENALRKRKSKMKKSNDKSLDSNNK